VADHTEFWVAAAAAAPIIALATQVALIQSSSLAYSKSARRESSVYRKVVFRALIVSNAEYVVGLANIALQGWVLFAAMESLSRPSRPDYWPTEDAARSLVIGLGLVVVSAVLGAELDQRKAFLAQFEKDEKEGRELLAQFQAGSELEDQARSRILKSVGVSGGRASRRR
jgi:hypothetical protein